MIKDYHDTHGITKNIEWLPADLMLFDPVSKIVDDLCEQQPDILALAVYVWNEDVQFEIAKIIKARLPNTVIVMGGPQLTAHKDKNFFHQHSYIDYVVYGDGEKAFADIIDYHTNAKPSRDGWVNTVFNDNGTYVIFPYERFADAAFVGESPYINQADLITQHIDKLVERGISRREIWAGVEFARGCMYNCSFCDWSQNLTKKVKRRKNDWRKVIDFFHDLDITIRETDANFGQWAEDIEIYNYAASLYDPKRNFKFVVLNTPKLKKDASAYFITQNLKLYDVGATISLQDINVDVLQKMERPSVSWQDHVEMIKQIKSDIGPAAKRLHVELILGAAGQSYDSISDTMYRICRDADVFRIRLFHWTLLPNAPAADPLYQKIHKLQWMPAYELTSRWKISALHKTLFIERYYESALDPATRPLLSRIQAIWSTATMTFPEMIAAQYLSHYLHDLRRANISGGTADFDRIFQSLKQRSLDEAHGHYETIEPLIQQHGFVIIGKWFVAERSFVPYWPPPVT